MGEKLDHAWLRQASTQTDQVKGIYDTWASTYDETVAEWGYQAPRMVAECLRAEVVQDAAILDVGCGTGLSGAALRQAGLTGPIHGIDVSPQSLQEAGERGVYASLNEVDLQALPLPFADHSFDALICVGVLTYVSNDASLLPEFARVVRSSGTVIVTQRTDYFGERAYPALLDDLSSVFGDIQVSGPHPYLPGNDQYGAEIGIFMIKATVK